MAKFVIVFYDDCFLIYNIDLRIICTSKVDFLIMTNHIISLYEMILICLSFTIFFISLSVKLSASSHLR